MAIWNRTVTYNATTGYLECSVSGDNPGSPPPRNDTGKEITTHPADRPATINYHGGTNVTLTGLVAKTGSTAPPYDPPANGGKLIQVNDAGAAAEYQYYVQGTVKDVTGTKQTEDPMIHNSSS